MRAWPGFRASARIEEGIAWLGRAQDHSLSQDGGVARHFGLIDGWSHSYPETTGYIVPTMIAHGKETGLAEPIERARRMLDWLVGIQFPEGGFRAAWLPDALAFPVTFNTGQILMGLAAGASLDPRYRDAMRQAADWLVATQDADGCWRKHPTPSRKEARRPTKPMRLWGSWMPPRWTQAAGTWKPR